ncbi:MAG: hypothetical protein M5R36_28865 [Deltaproteobacteria bacterium]|nr:hypothetical protein [Deltaproteobacteria bacterium]
MRPAKARRNCCSSGSHKDREGLQAALDAGCDEVMPRSKFVALLPSLVS